MRRLASSIAVPASAAAVLFSAPAYIETCLKGLVVDELENSRVAGCGRGSNQLLLKSKKH